jgi:hypothetical protein
MASSISLIVTREATAEAMHYLSRVQYCTTFEAICHGLSVLRDDLSIDAFYGDASEEEEQMLRELDRFPLCR